MTVAEAPPTTRPRRRVAPWIAGAVGVVLLSLVVLLATRDPATMTVARSPLVGRPAPELTGESVLDDDTTVRLSTLRGRFVLVNFVASWCVPCQREHDDLVRFSNAHAAIGDAVVLGVVWDDTTANIRRFFERRGGDWPVIDDANGKVALAFGVRGPPESFLVAPDGTVLTRIVGEIQDDKLEELLAKAQGRSVSE